MTGIGAGLAAAGDEAAPMLVARQLRKLYGTSLVLDDVSVTLGPGEIVSLAGENGSGKSTFAKILAGTVPPSGGAVSVAGEDVPLGKPEQSARHGIAVVPQEVTALPDLSVAENVVLPLHHSLLSLRHEERQVEEAQALLDSLGADVDARSPFRSLGPTEAVLVQLARALAIGPKVLVADETTASMEAHTARRVLEVLNDLAARGVSILFISHRLGEVCELAHRTVVLRDGKLVGELGAAEATPERIASMMVGREIERHVRGAARDEGGPRLVVDSVVLAPDAPPISFEVRAGEVVGLAGLANSGCERLLRRVAGASGTGGGTVAVDGRVVRPGQVRAALAAGIALLPGDRQREGLLREASVRVNIMLGAWPVSGLVDHGREDETSRRFVESFAIRPPDTERAVKMLSGGNQQKVLLARALRRQPSVLVLNEPTKGVDVGARADVYRVIRSSLEDGIGVLFFSTDMQEVIELADRVLVLYDNHLAAELEGEAISEDNISRSMGGSR